MLQRSQQYIVPDLRGAAEQTPIMSKTLKARVREERMTMATNDMQKMREWV
jgi:hypothetical protein